MAEKSDPVLMVVAWGTAVCGSLLAHLVIAGAATPDERVIEEVRIEIVALPTPKRPASKNATPSAITPSAAVKTDMVSAPGEANGARLSTAEEAVPPPRLETPGLFREGPKRASLEERNRRFDARQKALEPLRARLALAEERARTQEVDPEKTYACGGGDVDKVVRTRERDVGHWAPFVPHQLLTEEYAEGLSQIQRRGGKAVTTSGYVELALPARTLVLELEDPPGALLSVGLSHARCAVGLSHSKQGFPMTWRRIPMRLATADGTVVASVVDATLHEDASFLLRALDGRTLPFRTGRVQHGDEIASRLSTLSALARLLK